MPDNPFDATPSWSGYTYQGKLAVLHSLKTIVSSVESGQVAELAELSVELEWEEDFAIKKGAIYLSLHQVKAHKVSSPSKYKTALSYLFPKIKVHKDAIGYLHVWKDIVYTQDIVDFTTMLETYNVDGYDAEILERIKLYEYENGKYCGLEKVGDYIVKELDRYYKELNKTAVTAQQIDYAVIALFDIVDKHVMFRHKNQGSAKQPKEIRFSEILDVINKNFEEPSADYIFQKTKQFAINMVSGFCDNMMLCINNNCESVCGVKHMSVEIESMTPHELFWFLVHRSPDETVDEKNIGIEDYRSICDNVGIKNSLFKALYELPQSCYKKGLYINAEKTLYLPTTLHESDNSAEIAKNILSNPSINSILSLYNFDRFISKDVFIEDIVTMAGGIRSWDQEVIADFIESSGEKVNEIKKIKVLPIEIAKLEVL